MTQIVKVEYGIKGHKQIREEMKLKGADRVTEFKDYLYGYLIDEFLAEVKRQGFRHIGRARLLFEEAIDYQAKFEVTRIINRLNETKFTKIPKYAVFTLEDGHAPKIE